MNANNFWKAFGPVCGEQLHSSLMGVNVKAGSTFSRGMEWRECCVPARQEVGGGRVVGKGERVWRQKEGHRAEELHVQIGGGERMRMSLEEALNSSFLHSAPFCVSQEGFAGT